MTRLGDARKHVEHLDRLPSLVDEYLRNLPYLIAREPVIREYELVGHGHEPGGRPRTLTPDSIRYLSEEELAEKKRAAERTRAAHYQELYRMLGLKAVVRPDEGLEVS